MITVCDPATRRVYQCFPSYPLENLATGLSKYTYYDESHGVLMMKGRVLGFESDVPLSTDTLAFFKAMRPFVPAGYAPSIPTRTTFVEDSAAGASKRREGRRNPLVRLFGLSAPMAGDGEERYVERFAEEFAETLASCATGSVGRGLRVDRVPVLIAPLGMDLMSRIEVLRGAFRPVARHAFEPIEVYTAFKDLDAERPVSWWRKEPMTGMYVSSTVRRMRIVALEGTGRAFGCTSDVRSGTLMPVVCDPELAEWDADLPGELRGWWRDAAASAEGRPDVPVGDELLDRGLVEAWSAARAVIRWRPSGNWTTRCARSRTCWRSLPSTSPGRGCPAPRSEAGRSRGCAGATRG